MSITRQSFGHAPGLGNAHLYTLTCRGGATAMLTDYGARLTQLYVPDRAGRPANITTGFQTIDPYLARDPYFGCTVGRYANRIANARFTLDGKTCNLFANDGKNNLHGGKVGWDKALWRCDTHAGNAASVRFSHVSPNMDEGFPGKVRAAATFSLLDDNTLRIEYEATCDQPTPVNLTNHAYFNLAGVGSGDVLRHVVTIAASRYTPVDAGYAPTGQVAPVRGTPLDFTTPHEVGERIAQLGAAPGNTLGYDHNFVIDAPGKSVDTLGFAARVDEPSSGRRMEVWTTQPGVQFYTGNFLDGGVTGIGGAYHKHAAFCLETQHFPDSVNQPGFPSAILRPGQTYRHAVEYRFTAR